MSWAVEGCLIWQKEGLNMPDEVKEATDGYRQEMDTFSSFIEECCIVEEGRKVSNRSIRYAYETWCRENGDAHSRANFNYQVLFRYFRHVNYPFNYIVIDKKICPKDFVSFKLYFWISFLVFTPIFPTPKIYFIFIFILKSAYPK